MRVADKLAIAFFIGLLIMIYSHINLKVSYKYEVMDVDVDVLSLSPKEKIEAFHLRDIRKHEIVHQQNVTYLWLGVCSIGLIISLRFVFRKD